MPNADTLTGGKSDACKNEWLLLSLPPALLHAEHFGKNGFFDVPLK